MIIKVIHLKDGVIETVERDVTPEYIAQMYYPYEWSEVNRFTTEERKRYHEEICRLLERERQGYLKCRH